MGSSGSSNAIRVHCMVATPVAWCPHGDTRQQQQQHAAGLIVNWYVNTSGCLTSRTVSDLFPQWMAERQQRFQLARLECVGDCWSCSCVDWKDTFYDAYRDYLHPVAARTRPGCREFSAVKTGQDHVNAEPGSAEGIVEQQASVWLQIQSLAYVESPCNASKCILRFASPASGLREEVYDFYSSSAHYTKINA